jgi:hypothetical protein
MVYMCMYSLLCLPCSEGNILIGYWYQILLNRSILCVLCSGLTFTTFSAVLRRLIERVVVGELIGRGLNAAALIEGIRS